MYKLAWVLALAAVVIWVTVWVLPDNLLHVVFCDVGQGDATLITLKTTQILVDGGPDRRVLDCLDKHMPFYDHRIEVVMVTHPEADHITGLVDVYKRYTVLYFVSNGMSSNTHIWRELTKEVTQQKSHGEHLRVGEILKIGDLRLEAVWPTRAYIASGVNEDELNLSSLVNRLTFGEFDVLLAGDADIPVQSGQLETGVISEAEVLKVPHHGSKTGMQPEWLARVSPALAVISVGKNNFGHPAAEILEMLTKVGARVLRTDTNGEIEVVSDGVKWWVKMNK
jgi:competence protein ComEC